MDEKIKSLTDAINNTTESEKSKKIETINTALKALVLDGKFSVPKKDNPTEQESKTFDGNINNDEIASIIESLIKDEPDQAKKNKYKSDLTAALQGARDALKTLASESQIRQAIENETTQTSDSLSGLATEVNDNMHIYSTQELAKFVEAGEQKGKSRKELRATPGYIRTIQNFILELGAQDPSIDKKKLEDGIYGNATEAGVLTIQKILNKPPYNSYKNLIEDGKPGPFTLGALLYTIDGKITWNKLLEDKKSGKLIITPELVKKTEDQSTKSKKQSNKPSTKSVDPKGGIAGEKKVGLKKIEDKDGRTINGIVYANHTSKSNPPYMLNEYGNPSNASRDNGRYENGKWIPNIEQTKKETINPQEYKEKGNSLIFQGKDKNSYYLSKVAGQIYIMKNNISSLSIDNDIDEILNSIGDNPFACAKLIDMSTGGRGTYDIPLEKILNHIIKNKSFIDVANAYKKLGFSSNNKNNLLEMLMKETYTNGGIKGNPGYDRYFVNFFEGLLQQNPGTVKKILLKSDIKPTYELLNSEKFNTRRKNNNIQRIDGKRQ